METQWPSRRVMINEEFVTHADLQTILQEFEARRNQQESTFLFQCSRALRHLMKKAEATSAEAVCLCCHERPDQAVHCVTCTACLCTHCMPQVMQSRERTYLEAVGEDGFVIRLTCFLCKGKFAEDILPSSRRTLPFLSGTPLHP